MINRVTNDDEEFLCPCCQKIIFHQDEEYDICLVCLWQYEKAQLLDPNYCGGANALSLNEYKKLFLDRIMSQK